MTKTNFADLPGRLANENPQVTIPIDLIVCLYSTADCGCDGGKDTAHF